MQEAKGKVLERVKDLKDTEIVDGITSAAADYVESQDFTERLVNKLAVLIDGLIDDLPRRVKWVLGLLGVRKWINKMLGRLKQDVPSVLAQELRDFSQPS